MNCLIFKKCEHNPLWVAAAVMLLAIPKSLSPAYLPFNIVVVGSFFLALFLVLKALRVDALGYLSVASFILVAMFFIATSILVVDNFLGFGGVVSSALATILIYYSIVLLAYHLEMRGGSLLHGLLGVLLWYGFYFYVLRATF